MVTFDIVNTSELIDPWFVTWDDNGTPYSFNFEECGFETTWFLYNSSPIVWIYCLHIVMFLVFLLVKAIFRRCGRLQAVHRKLTDYFFFNGMIRLFTETFLDLYVSSLLNIVAADWQTSSGPIKASNGASLGVFALSSLIVFVLAFVYFRNFNKIDAQSNYGALLSGTKLNAKQKSKWNLLLPAFLFGRRISFTFAALLFDDFLWAQIVMMISFSIGILIFLVSAKPFESYFATKIEVFNEATLVMLSYGLMMFTDYVVDPMVRYAIGW